MYPLLDDTALFEDTRATAVQPTGPQAAGHPPDPGVRGPHGAPHGSTGGGHGPERGPPSPSGSPPSGSRSSEPQSLQRALGGRSLTVSKRDPPAPQRGTGHDGAGIRKPIEPLGFVLDKPIVD